MHNLVLFLALVATVMPVDTNSNSTTPAGVLVLDDFADPHGISSRGSRWSAFTDRVMGGVSDMSTEFHRDDDVPHLHMTGEVRLENDGGFVQVALPLDVDGRVLDASGYRAIRLRVRGNGTGYFVHLRTDDTRAPWQYYAAPFEAPGAWTTVEIPFHAFEPRSLRTGLDTTSLRRVGIVAYGRRMRADIAVARLELVH